MTFVQGLAGIAGVIVAQVRAARTGAADAQTGLAVAYDPRTRTVDLHLDRPADVQVIAWWATSFTPPEPRSTSLVLLDAWLPAGQRTVTLPGEVPPQASFVTVAAGDEVQSLIVGPCPRGRRWRPSRNSRPSPEHRVSLVSAVRSRQGHNNGDFFADGDFIPLSQEQVSVIMT